MSRSRTGYIWTALLNTTRLILEWDMPRSTGHQHQYYVLVPQCGESGMKHVPFHNRTHMDRTLEHNTSHPRTVHAPQHRTPASIFCPGAATRRFWNETCSVPERNMSCSRTRHAICPVPERAVPCSRTEHDPGGGFLGNQKISDPGNRAA